MQLLRTHLANVAHSAFTLTNDEMCLITKWQKLLHRCEEMSTISTATSCSSQLYRVNEMDSFLAMELYQEQDH